MYKISARVDLKLLDFIKDRIEAKTNQETVVFLMHYYRQNEVNRDLNNTIRARLKKNLLKKEK